MVRFSPALIVTNSSLWLSVLNINETENIKDYGKRKMVACFNLCRFAYWRLRDVFEVAGWSGPGKGFATASNYRHAIETRAV